MWRIQNGKISQHIYPAVTSRLFPMLKNVDKIDAALENDDGQLVFFSGMYFGLAIRLFFKSENSMITYHRKT